jgi:DNA invertase Pin-like site-specific DNA recombinase
VRLVGYLRVSTDRQAEEGLGLEVQEEAIRSWAVAEGHDIVGWTRDEGVSGTNGLDDRPGLADALDAVQKGNAKKAPEGAPKGLAVYRLDRLARDLILQEHLLAEVRKAGGQTFSTSSAEADYMTDDPADPSRKLIRQILGGVAEYERAMIALRLRSGRQRKRDGGGFAFGSPPFGFRAQDRELVEDPAEQRGLARIRELRSEGKSLRAIAAILNTEGRIKPKRAARWNPQSLKRILDADRAADSPAGQHGPGAVGADEPKAAEEPDH